MPHTHIVDRNLAALLIIDVQEKLAPHIAGHKIVIENTVKLIRAARVLELPILATEQNPRRIGATVAPIREALPGDVKPLEKETFSCWGDAPFRAALGGTNREHVIVAGIESHVCVLKTVLELIRVDYVPFVLSDAVGSRRESDRDAAIRRMREAGAVITTTESMILELLTSYTQPEFKPLLQIIK
ncbi:MAG: hydrolase [Phycisphaerae bacterium]